MWPGSRAPRPRRMPRASSTCWVTGARIRGACPPCSSTLVRRSTWQGWSVRMRTAWRARGRSSVRARAERPSSDCAARLVLPDDAYHYALHHDIALVDTQRRHGWVGGLEPDPPARLPIEPLDRSTRALHQRDHRLAVVGLVALVDHDEVAVLDVLVDHRLTADLQYVAPTTAGDQLVGHRDRVRAADRFDGRAGGHQAVQRQIGGADLGRDEVQDLALSACERHILSRTETEGKSTRKSTERKHAGNQA